jgi:acyl carrier protein
MLYATKHAGRSGSRAPIHRNGAVVAMRSLLDALEAAGIGLSRFNQGPTRPLVDPLQSEFVETRPGVEQELSQIWVRFLRTPRVGSLDDFFELGGDSISAARVMAEIEKRFGIHLPLETLLAVPTIDRLAEVIRAERRAQQGAVRPQLLGTLADRLRTFMRRWRGRT